MIQQQILTFFSKVLIFIVSPRTWIITVGTIAAVFLAFQSKLPLDLTFNNMALDIDQQNQQRNSVDLRLPVAHYRGPLVFTLKHNATAQDMEVNLISENALLARAYVAKGDENQILLFVYSGSYDLDNGLSLTLTSSADLALEEIIKSVEIRFPKVGIWLVPDYQLWFSLVLLIFFFGLISALIWESKTIIHSCFSATSVMITMVIFLWGPNIAMRISNQLFAVIFLFLITAIIRSMVLPDKKMKVRSKANQ